MGSGPSTKKSVFVQCSVGDKPPVLLCSLLQEKSESCPLNLEFEEYEDVVFSVIGPKSVHLTGFFMGPSGEYDDQDDDDDDSYPFDYFLPCSRLFCAFSSLFSCMSVSWYMGIDRS